MLIYWRNYIGIEKLPVTFNWSGLDVLEEAWALCQQRAESWEGEIKHRFILAIYNQSGDWLWLGPGGQQQEEAQASAALMIRRLQEQGLLTIPYTLKVFQLGSYWLSLPEPKSCQPVEVILELDQPEFESLVEAIRQAEDDISDLKVWLERNYQHYRWQEQQHRTKLMLPLVETEYLIGMLDQAITWTKPGGSQQQRLTQLRQIMAASYDKARASETEKEEEHSNES